ncbi:TetR/AcrR family transcriptional regulator [Actinoallomurus spadix]|nr:TetR family transcriptional regulator [Actinoallomurus spadix]MCO5985139.1 TetR/AcrR family transcriptional regulator [Actinoallomurus spadix]
MDHMGLRERKKRQTRRAIAEAALRLFAERGYEETTIADIAGAADVSPRTFFSYFPSKEDVVFAEIDERLTEVREGIDRRPADETPLESMRRIVLEMIEAIAAEHGEYGAIQVRLVLERPSLQARALKRMNDTEQYVVERLTELCPGIDEIDAVVIAGALVGGMKAVITHCRAHGYAPEATRRAVDRALAIVEHGLGSVPALTHRATE